MGHAGGPVRNCGLALAAAVGPGEARHRP